MASFLSQSSIFFVAKKENKIVSFLLAMDLIDSINILLVATENEFKNQGFSTKLIENLKTLNKKLWLEVRESNFIAQNLYKKCDFKPTHMRKKYYSNGENAIIFEFENI